MRLTSHPLSQQADEQPQDENTSIAEETEQSQLELAENRIGLNGLRSVSFSRSRRSTRSAVPNVEVSFELADLLPHIPGHYLKPGSRDAHQLIRFRANHLLHGLSRGRATATLSSIAGRCPGVFRGPINYGDDIDVPLPLEKIVEQLGELPVRADQMPAPEIAPDSRFQCVAIKKPDEQLPQMKQAEAPTRSPQQNPDPEQKIRALLSAALQSLPEKIAAGQVKADANSVRIDLPAEVLHKLQADQPNKPAEEPQHPISPVEEVGEEIAPLDPTLVTPVPPDEPHPDVEQPEPPQQQPESMSLFSSKQSEKNQPPPPPLFKAQPPMQRTDTTPEKKAVPGGITLSRQDLNHDQLLESLAGFTGVDACIIASKNRLTLTGEIPEEFDIQKFRQSAPDLLKSLNDFAGPTRLGKVTHATLQCDSQLATFAGQGDMCVCVFHQDHDFLEGFREKLRSLFDGASA